MTRRGGFTLIEVMAALLLVSLVAALAAGALRLSTRSQERLLARSEAMEEKRIVLGQLRRYLEAAEPVALADEREIAVAFRGEAAALHFAALMPGSDGKGGLWLVRIAIEAAGSGHSLVLDRRLLTTGPPGFDFAAGAEHGVLAAGFRAAAFAYSDGGAWTSRWDDPWRLPAKIRLTLEGADGPWPDLVVAPARRRVRR